MLYIFTPKCKRQKENQAQLTQANSSLNFVVNMKTTTLTEHQKCSGQQYVNSCNETVKKNNKPSQQKLKNKAALQLKSTYFTIHRKNIIIIIIIIIFPDHQKIFLKV